MSNIHADKLFMFHLISIHAPFFFSGLISYCTALKFESLKTRVDYKTRTCSVIVFWFRHVFHEETVSGVTYSNLTGITVKRLKKKMGWASVQSLTCPGHALNGRNQWETQPRPIKWQRWCPGVSEFVVSPEYLSAVLSGPPFLLPWARLISPQRDHNIFPAPSAILFSIEPWNLKSTGKRMKKMDDQYFMPRKQWSFNFVARTSWSCIVQTGLYTRDATS